MLSWDELRQRIIRWEQFANEHSQLPETEKDIRPKISWMVDVYLTGIDNSRILKAENMLNEEVKNSYEAFLKEGTSSAHFEVVKGAFDIWNKNQFKLSKELVDYLKEKGHARFIYLLEQSLRTAGGKKSQDATLPPQANEGYSAASGFIIASGILLVVVLIAKSRRSSKKSS
jgi:hypothetical protein